MSEFRILGFGIIALCFISMVKSNGVEIMIKRIDPKEKINAATCVQKIIQKYAARKVEQEFRGNVVQIKTGSAMTTRQHLLKKIHTDRKISVIIKNSMKKRNSTGNLYELSDTYILLMDHALDINTEMSTLAVHPNWNPQAKFFIVIDQVDLLASDIVRIFNILRMYRVFDSFIITASIDANKVESFTWFPYRGNYCGNSCEEAVRLDLCTDGMMKQLNPLQKKIPSDLHKCSVNLMAIICEPYVMPAIIENNDSDEINKGIEITLLEVITKRLNMTLEIRPIFSYDDGTTDYDYIALLENEETDIVIGSLFPKLWSRSYDTMQYYLQDHLAWCVPLASSESLLENLKDTFSTQTWALIIGSAFVVSLITQYLIVQDDDTKSFWPFATFFIVCSMLLGNISRVTSKRTMFKLLFSGWLVLCVITNVIIQCSLSSSLIHPKKKWQINSENEIFSSNLDFGGHSIHINNIARSEENTDFFNKYVNCFPVHSCVKRVVEGGFAIIAPQSFMNYHQEILMNNSLVPVMHCMKKDYFETYSPMIMTWKNYPLRRKMQNIISRVFESGLLFKWYSNIISYKPKLSNNALQKSLTEGLHFEEAWNVIVIYLFAIASSILVFISEVFFYKFMKIKVTVTK